MLKGKVAVITGGTRGIGFATAKKFLENEAKLVLLGSKQETVEKAIKELKQINSSYEVIGLYPNLSSKEEMNEVFKKVKEIYGRIDILINNAGFGDHGAFHDSSWEKQKKMVLLNIMALMQMTYVFGQSMKLRKKGRILNVASIAGLCAGPYMSTYYATKAFVLSFSESIAYELKDYNVEVSCLCPGPTKTGFMDVANLGQSPMFKLFKPQSAEAVAEIGIQGLFDNRLVQFTGLSGHLLNLVARLLPRSFLSSCTGFVNGKRKV